MLLSVLVCTYNRSANLKDLLECLLKQGASGDFDHEVIVVDNNSNDNTAELVKGYLPAFQGRLRYFFEPVQGKSNALNRGIAEAQGALVVCTDDDCIVEPDYLQSVYSTFQGVSADVGFIGGKILPLWQGGEQPAWLTEVFALPHMDGKRPNWYKIFFEGPLGIMDYGPDPFTIDYSQKDEGIRMFYGANMAFRRDVFQKVGGFRRDKKITQDTEICQRLLMAGIDGLYAPRVKVFHKIKIAGVTPKYYYRWYFRRGRYLEQPDEYKRKFYHLMGLQYYHIAKTLGFFIKSINEPSMTKRLYERCQGYLNLGKMVKIVKKNIF